MAVNNSANVLRIDCTMAFIIGDKENENTFKQYAISELSKLKPFWLEYSASIEPLLKETKRRNDL